MARPVDGGGRNADAADEKGCDKEIQCRNELREVWYLHTGLSFFDMWQMPRPDHYCFLGLNFSLFGPGGGKVMTDTGGCSFLYLSRNLVGNGGGSGSGGAPAVAASGMSDAQRLTSAEEEEARRFLAFEVGRFEAMGPSGFADVADWLPAYRGEEVERRGGNRWNSERKDRGDGAATAGEDSMDEPTFHKTSYASESEKRKATLGSAGPGTEPEVQPCWLRTASESDPLSEPDQQFDCSNSSIGAGRINGRCSEDYSRRDDICSGLDGLTYAQRNYCETVPTAGFGGRQRQRLRAGGDPLTSAGPFVHLRCGSGWCRSFLGWDDALWWRGSADATLQLLQERLGGSCPHCSVVQALQQRICEHVADTAEWDGAATAAGLPDYSLEHQPKSVPSCPSFQEKCGN